MRPHVSSRPADLADRRVLRLLALAAGLALTAGCGSKKDCAAEVDATARDWCWFEQASKAAQDDELQEAVTAVQQIQDPMVKSSAVDKVIFADPSGLDQTIVQRLCSQVEPPYDTTCLRTWNRPHLWEK